MKERIIATYETHRLEGLGDIIYDYERDKFGHFLLTITIPDMDATKTISGYNAKLKYEKMIADSWDNIIQKIKSIACESIGIANIAELNIKTKKKEIVFARNCVWWHCNKYFGFTQQMCGDIFGMDHASAFHGIKDFYKSFENEKRSNPDYKFQTPERKIWAERFLQKTKEAYIIDKDIFKPTFIEKSQ